MIDSEIKCVFCNEKPKDKNKEHVIPKWLIELTGKKSRKVNFGHNVNADKQIKFSWDRLTVPSCKKCNDKFAKLESKIKPIIIRLINKDNLNGIEILLLLDWLDKVRIGLWINYKLIEGNKAQITPQFGIAARMGRKDRFLKLHFLESEKENIGINAFGVETFLFQIAPTCFGLRINNILLINGSSDFIISENCGFPFPSKIGVNDEGSPDMDKFVYEKYLKTEICNIGFHKSVLSVKQPIQVDYNFLDPYYNDPELKNKCLNWKNRIGKLFRTRNSKISQIDELELLLEFEGIMGKDVKRIGQIVSKIYRAQINFVDRFFQSNDELINIMVELNKKNIYFYDALNKDVT